MSEENIYNQINKLEWIDLKMICCDVYFTNKLTSKDQLIKEMLKNETCRNAILYIFIQRKIPLTNILKYELDPNFRYRNTGKTLLINACDINEPDSVFIQLLIEKKCNVDDVDDTGRSAIFYVLDKDPELVKLLIYNGANLDICGVNDLSIILTCICLTKQNNIKTKQNAINNAKFIIQTMKEKLYNVLILNELIPFPISGGHSSFFKCLVEYAIEDQIKFNERIRLTSEQISFIKSGHVKIRFK